MTRFYIFLLFFCVMSAGSLALAEEKVTLEECQKRIPFEGFMISDDKILDEIIKRNQLCKELEKGTKNNNKQLAVPSEN